MHIRLLAILAAVLSLCQVANSQFPTEGILEHSLYLGMPAVVPFYADPVFAKCDAETLRLKGPVAKVLMTVQTHEGPADAAEPVPTVTMDFDVERNITRCTFFDGGSTVCRIANEYSEPRGSRLMTARTVTLEAEKIASERIEHIFDDSGQLVRRSGTLMEPKTIINLEYDAGRPIRALADTSTGDPPHILTFDEKGRLIERAEGKDGQSKLTIIWLAERQFEVHSVHADVKKLEGKGTLDEHGSLFEWSWQAMTVEPRLVRFRNEITYDDHANWTKLVTYVEAAPGEDRPSSTFLTATRQITYR